MEHWSVFCILTYITSMAADRNSVISKLIEETDQGPGSRIPLLAEIEKELHGRHVLAFFTTFYYPALLEDSDADILEDMLRNADLQHGLTMILNCPGGLPLSAERITNVCREYSNGDFEVIVPKMAKSAATMICFGANKIWMSKTSELGPIDPQVAFREEGRLKSFSVHSMIEGYRQLLRQASETQGNVEPYLLQLGKYDAREITLTLHKSGLERVLAVKPPCEARR